MGAQIEMDSNLANYVTRMSLRDDEILAELRNETARFPVAHAMLVMPEEAQFIALLARTIRATSALEVGTFTGYTTLCLARSLGAAGRVVTCDISEVWTRIAGRYWQRAGVRDRIDLRIGDAVETLSAILEADGPECFDLVFVDADKERSVHYYEQAITLTKPGGLVILDNTLFFGRVIDPEVQDAATVAIRELNRTVRDDTRVESSLLSIGDGVTIVRKRDH
ncbi:O-methyltransferase [Streptosporangium fragile]|uniref:O-methyltransferase n=1 Tax=Streptosporangium fragile TaxID=46186 RepID=A0ABN3WCW1_9ACTN